MIEETLAKIQSRLQSATVDDRKRHELQHLFTILRVEVSKLHQTHSAQAESIASVTERSTDEATRDQQNPQALKSTLGEMSSSVEQFEKSHPTLVGVVNTFSQALSNLGI